MWRDISLYISSSLLVAAQNKHELTSEGMMKETVKLNEMYQVGYKRPISVSTTKRDMNTKACKQFYVKLHFPQERHLMSINMLIS